LAFLPYFGACKLLVKIRKKVTADFQITRNDFKGEKAHFSTENQE
jgi:hypothetical protein